MLLLLDLGMLWLLFSCLYEVSLSSRLVAVGVSWNLLSNTMGLFSLDSVLIDMLFSLFLLNVWKLAL